MTEEEMTLSMAEGEMNVELFGQQIHTKGFRLYSLILIALLGLFVAIAIGSKEIAVISNVVTYLLGVFTAKKA